MSKELPYFRFTVSEWLNDDISLEDYRLQGVFASVCAFYWFQDCSITKAKLKKRFNDAIEEIEALIELDIIKEEKDDFIQVKFLDEQYDMLSEKRKKRAEAGRKGGLARASNAKAKLDQSLSYKDKDKDKEKDKKESNIPSLQEVKDYFLDNGYSVVAAEKAYDYYQESVEGTSRRYWRDGKDNTIKNWKMKMQSVWFKPENEIKDVPGTKLRGI